MIGGYLVFSHFINLDCHTIEQIRLWLPQYDSQRIYTLIKGLLSLGFLLPPTMGRLRSVMCVSLKSSRCWLWRNLLDFSHRDKFSLEPAVIFQSFINTNFLSLQFHFGMVDIWILSWGMVSPYDDILYIIRSHSKFKSNLV